MNNKFAWLGFLKRSCDLTFMEYFVSLSGTIVIFHYHCTKGILGRAYEFGHSLHFIVHFLVLRFSGLHDSSHDRDTVQCACNHNLSSLFCGVIPKWSVFIANLGLIQCQRWAFHSCWKSCNNSVQCQDWVLLTLKIEGDFLVFWFC